MKFNFIIIPAIIIATSYFGVRYAKKGLNSWYAHLKKPKWTPTGKIIGEIWTFLYVITGFAVMWFWNVPIFSFWHYIVGALLLANAYLNATWNRVFFVEHNFKKAYQRMVYMNVTAIAATVVMIFIAPIAAVFMLPYIVWVAIATKLEKEVWHLNKK